MGKTKKDGKIELLRFLAICFIMCDHMAQIGLGDLPRPFTGTWIYVEFFLILSGFMTARHFCMRKEERPVGMAELEYAVHESVRYTIRKYSKFLPYVIPAVLAEYMIKYYGYLADGNILDFQRQLQDMPFEMFLLSTAGTNGTRLFPIWFLSATALVSPIINLIAQIRNNYVKGMITLYPAIFYYLNKAHGIGSHEYPNQILRALCGMLLGVFVFVITEEFKKQKTGKVVKWFLTGALIATFCILMYVGYMGYRGIDNIYIISFIIIVLLSFSQQTFFPAHSNSLLYFLGKISMPMFIWHWVVAHLLVLIIPVSHTISRILVYFLGTFVVSIISMCVVEMFMRARTRRKDSEYG